MIENFGWLLVPGKKTAENELSIIQPILEKLNEQWFEKGDFIWTGRFDDDKTSMAIFEATMEKATKYYDAYSKICSAALDTNMHQCDALPLFTIIERIQGKI